jgi:hypothetical protein
VRHRAPSSLPAFLLALIVLLGALAASAPAAPRAARDGTLALQEGRGRFVLQLTGSVIGRIERGKLTIEDPFGQFRGDPIVRGHDWVRVRGTSVVYGGKGIRFRILGGRFSARIENAVGVDLSVIGRGRAIFNGAGLEEFGLSNGEYSVNGGELRPVPDDRVSIVLRAPPRPKPRFR